MGVDINRKIITGAMYTHQQLNDATVKEYFEGNQEGEVKLIQLNVYGDGSLPDFIFGVVDEILEKDEQRADANPEVRAYLEELEPNRTSVKKVISAIELKGYPKKFIGTYKLTYFS
jgi:hypothetical protein